MKKIIFVQIFLFIPIICLAQYRSPKIGAVGNKSIATRSDISDLFRNRTFVLTDTTGKNIGWMGVASQDSVLYLKQYNNPYHHRS